VGRKAKSGDSVLDMVIGAFVALVFLGLPVAIIGLFIASTLDRRHAKPPEGYTALREPKPSAYATSQEGNQRRRIIYGSYSAATAPAERYEPTRVHGRKD
jgi:hypothetical protein